MKNLGSPPSGVIITARVVLILFNQEIALTGSDDKVWKKAQNVMNNPGAFIDKIKAFDGENIQQSLLDSVNIIINDPAKKFNEKDMMGQSFAASKLCAWAVNIVVFNRIFKEVKPLQDSEARATNELYQKTKELQTVKLRVA